MRYLTAPMEDHTDAAFRTLCYSHGADATFTEMSWLAALCRKIPVTLARVDIKDNTPTYIQFIGSNEQELEQYLSFFKPQPGFLGFNLNLGCPSPAVIKEGLGCAMMKRTAKVARMGKIIQSVGYSFSLKIRLGLNKSEKDAKVYLNLINGVDADFIVVHARHGGQNYGNAPDFSAYPECVATGRQIYANGDISTAGQIKELEEIGIKGVMIGRAATTDPAIFDKLKGKPTPEKKELLDQYIKLADSYGSGPKYRQHMMKRLGDKAP